MSNQERWLNQTHVGDCREFMRRMIADGVRVNCVVTSPPYWGLRDYGVEGQIGLEPTLVDWLDCMVEVFRTVREILADDGTLWLNLGDAYANDGKWGGNSSGKHAAALHGPTGIGRHKKTTGLKPKDLMGQAWRVALALQDDGWWLRSEIIWAKPNPMPESVVDRPTKAHEHIFLLARSDRYYYDGGSIREPSSPDSHARASRARLKGYEAPGQTAHQGIVGPRAGVNPKAKPVSGWAWGPGDHSAIDHAKPQRLQGNNGVGFGHGYDKQPKLRVKQNESFAAAVVNQVTDRNARTVWTIPTQSFSGAHFATFPEELAKRCILAGSRPGDIVFDPFHGSGTTGAVALSLGRNFIGLELNPEYAKMGQELRSSQVGFAL